jgi:hypothetical protein
MAENIPQLFLSDGRELARLRNRLSDAELEDSLRHLPSSAAAFP